MSDYDERRYQELERQIRELKARVDAMEGVSLFFAWFVAGGSIWILADAALFKLFGPDVSGMKLWLSGIATFVLMVCWTFTSPLWKPIAELYAPTLRRLAAWDARLKKALVTCVGLVGVTLLLAGVYDNAHGLLWKAVATVPILIVMLAVAAIWNKNLGRLVGRFFGRIGAALENFLATKGLRTTSEQDRWGDRLGASIEQPRR
jgi:hypothetical protein